MKILTQIPYTMSWLFVFIAITLFSFASKTLGISNLVFYYGLITIIFITLLLFCYLLLFLKKTRNVYFIVGPFLVLFWFLIPAFFGPFNPIPSDFLLHLNHIKFASIQINYWPVQRITLSPFDDIANLHGYILYAAIKRLFSLSLVETYSFVSLFTCVSISLIIYELTNSFLAKFTQSKVDYGALQISSFLTVICAPFLLGVDSFSYFRAYSASAGILGFCSYLGMITVFLKITNWNLKSVFYFGLMSIFVMFGQYLNHPQELLFSIAFILSVVTYITFNKFYPLLIEYRFSLAVFACFALLMIILLNLFHFFQLVDTSRYVIRFDVFGHILAFGNPVTISERVLGLGGLFVVIAGLMVPFKGKYTVMFFFLSYLLWTIFNPILMQIMSSGSVLPSNYRFLYGSLFFLLPGFLFYWLLCDGKQVHWFARLGTICLVSVAVFGSDKWKSFVNVTDAERLSHWGDLVSFAENIEQFKIVYTDPVTGYLLNGTTGLQFYGSKYFESDGFVPFKEENFPRFASLMDVGEYLVINQRNGDNHGFIGNSGHFPDGILELSEKYHPRFIDKVISDERFKQVWRSSDFKVHVFQKSR